MNKKKVVEFVKTHKKDVATVAIMAVVGTIGVVLLKKAYDEERAFIKTCQESYEKFKAESAEKIAKLDWKVGELTEIWDEGDYTNAIVNQVPVDQLGALGEEFKKIEGITDDTELSMVIGLVKNTEI